METANAGASGGAAHTAGRTGLAVALSLVLPLIPRFASAQAPAPTPAPPPVDAGLLQLSRPSTRQASNLAAPVTTYDSFLGQDKPGPYVLTWHGFLSGPSSPVQVFIDGRLQMPGQYTIDPVKGEIVFEQVIRRNQMVRVSYSYQKGVASRNPNPAPAAALTVSLATVGLANLQMAAVPGDGAVPHVVWGLNSQRSLLGGGMSTQIYFNPDRTDGENRSMGGDSISRMGMRLGYNSGNDKNGLGISFLRGGREFAAGLGKNFGFGEATQALGIKGNLNPAKWMGLTLNRNEVRDLTGKGATATENFGLRFGGAKGQPSLGFTRSNDIKRDGAGVLLAGNEAEKGDLSLGFGALKLVGATSKSDVTTTDKKRTFISSQNFALNLAGKPNQSALSVIQTGDDKINPDGSRATNSAESLGFTRLFGVGDLTYKRIAARALDAKQKETRTGQSAMGFTMAPGKSGRIGLALNRTEDFRVDPAGVRTSIATDRIEATRLFGGLTLIGQRQSGAVIATDNSETALTQSALGFAYTGKNQPSLSMMRTRDLSVAGADARTSTLTDKVDFAHKFGAINLVAKLNHIGATTADDKRSWTDQQTLGFTLAPPKAPKLAFSRTGDMRADVNGLHVGTRNDKIEFGGVINNVTLAATSLNSDVATANGQRVSGDQQTYTANYGGAKGRPNMAFTRTEDEKRNPGAGWFGTIIDRYDLSHKIGVVLVTFQYVELDSVALDQRRASDDTHTYGVTIPGGKARASIGLVRTDDQKVDVDSMAVGTVTDKVTVTQPLGAATIAATSTHSTITADDPKVTGTAQETAVSLTTPGGTKGTSATFAVSNGASQNGAGTAQSQGVSVKIQPTPTITISAEQRDQVITPRTDGVEGKPRTISGQTAGAEIVPMPGAKLTTAWTSQDDGTNKMSIMDLGAQLGHDNSALQLTGTLRQRNGNASGFNGMDTANARFTLRPFVGVVVTGLVIMNPEDPKDKNKLVPSVKREYTLTAKIGSFDLAGSYSVNTFPGGTPVAIIQQAGASAFGETAFKLGLRFDRLTTLTGTYKDTFFARAPQAKGLRTIDLGIKRDLTSLLNFTVTGSLIENRAAVAPAPRKDLKGEAKLNVKF